jgi:hypothetical protein
VYALRQVEPVDREPRLALEVLLSLLQLQDLPDRIRQLVTSVQRAFLHGNSGMQHNTAQRLLSDIEKILLCATE